MLSLAESWCRKADDLPYIRSSPAALAVRVGAQRVAPVRDSFSLLRTSFFLPFIFFLYLLKLENNLATYKATLISRALKSTFRFLIISPFRRNATLCYSLSLFRPFSIGKRKTICRSRDFKYFMKSLFYFVIMIFFSSSKMNILGRHKTWYLKKHRMILRRGQNIVEKQSRDWGHRGTVIKTGQFEAIKTATDVVIYEISYVDIYVEDRAERTYGAYTRLIGYAHALKFLLSHPSRIESFLLSLNICGTYAAFVSGYYKRHGNKRAIASGVFVPIVRFIFSNRFRIHFRLLIQLAPKLITL